MQHPSPASDLSPLPIETPDAGNDSESVASVDSVANDDATTGDGKAALPQDNKRKTPLVHPPLKKLKTHEANDGISFSVEHIQGSYSVVPTSLLEELVVAAKDLKSAQDAFKNSQLEYEQAFQKWRGTLDEIVRQQDFFAIEAEDSDDSEADELDDSEADEQVGDETEEVSVVDNAATPEDLSDEDDLWIELSP